MAVLDRRNLARAACALAACGLGIGAAVAGPAEPGAEPSVLSPLAPFAPRPAAAADGLAAFDDCSELRDWYVEQALPQVTAWGFGWGGYYLLERDMAFSAARVTAESSSPKDAVGNNETGTNVQEAGVDEPDVAKVLADGTTVVSVRGRTLVVTDTSGDEPREISRLSLPRDTYSYELLVVGDRVVVIGHSYADDFTSGRLAYKVGWGGGSEDTRITTVDVAVPAAPRIVGSRLIQGTLQTARETDGTIRLVTTYADVALPFVHPGKDYTRAEAREHNRDLVRGSTVDAWLPQGLGSTFDGGTPLLDCSDVQHPAVDSGFGTLTVVTFDPAEPSDLDATAITTDGSLVYASPDRLYVSTVSGGWTGWAEEDSDDRTPDTTVHSFDTTGPTTSYVASGEVAGVAPDRWAFSEQDGLLRVATTRNKNWWRPVDSAVTVLAEQGGRLVTIGEVGGLGKTEEIKAVRWFADLAVVVTFRQTDPLYTVDLGDPTRPRVTGELKIPGFSEYLHPIGDDLILGVGQSATRRGATTGSQLSVFDLSPVDRLATLDLDGWYSPVEYDARAFTYLPEQRLALVPVSARGGQRLQVVHLTAAGAPVEVRTVTLGGWSENVRTLPVGGGRVAVVHNGVVDIVLDPADLDPPTLAE